MSNRVGWIDTGLTEEGKRLLATADGICPLHRMPLPPRKRVWCGKGDERGHSCYWAFRFKYGGIQDWKEIRERVILRDGGRCVNCRRKYNPRNPGTKLEVDHIVEIQDGGPEFDFANLRTLCHDCHLAKTNGRRRYGPGQMAESKLKDRVRPVQRLETWHGKGTPPAAARTG
jgi:HNH endonuclease